MDIGNLSGNRDPFALEADANEEDGTQQDNSGAVHIRVQQRNGRKCITTVQGIDPAIDLKKILKVVKKKHCCNGTVVEDEDMGHVLQLQGDQRDAMVEFLTENEIVSKDKIKKHGVS